MAKRVIRTLKLPVVIEAGFKTCSSNGMYGQNGAVMMDEEKNSIPPLTLFAQARTQVNEVFHKSVGLAYRQLYDMTEQTYRFHCL